MTPVLPGVDEDPLFFAQIAGRGCDDRPAVEDDFDPGFKGLADILLAHELGRPLRTGV